MDAEEELVFNIDNAKDPEDAEKKRLDEVALMRRLKGWWKSDADHRRKWRKSADEDFAFVANHHWTKEDEEYMKEKGRVPVTFNRVLTVIKSIAGSEINGRLDTRYLPRGTEDTKVNEMLSAASEWMSDQCDAEDEQSEAFEAALITGEGWTEARIDYDEDPQGMYVEEEVDPREMFPDCKARKKNYADSRRRSRVRRVSITEARAMFPNTPDEDLDASWANWDGLSQKEPRPVEDQNHSQEAMDDPVEADRSDVTLVHMQWWEKEAYWLVAQEPDPTLPPEQQQDKPEELTNDEYKLFDAHAKEVGIRFQAAKLMKKVYKHAFMGNKLLEHGPSPFPKGFTFNCITGERDRKEGCFFGLVRVMRDPQMWANKMLSNTLHIANTTAKGGIIAEMDAFEDQRQAEESYAQPDEITWAAEGAVEKKKIMEKPGTGNPSVYIKLLEFAIASIRDVTGVNMELLGLRDANQPGVLEAQRKQAAMTVLASMFNSLRRFRKGVGRVRLHLIQTHMSDGRLIRIKGKDGDPKVLPLLRDSTAGEYDVIVADAPTSPNQKEATWALITQVLPVFKDMLTPEVMLALLEFSPFPTDLVEMLRQLKMQADQKNAQTAQITQQQVAEDRQAMLRQAHARAASDEASAGEKQVKAQTIGANIQNENLKSQSEAMRAQADAQGSMAEAEGKKVTARADAMKTLEEAHAVRAKGEADARKGHADAALVEAKATSQPGIDQLTMQNLMADFMQKMASLMDQKIQTALAVSGQEHDQSMAEKALEGKTELQRGELKLKSQSAKAT